MPDNGPAAARWTTLEWLARQRAGGARALVALVAAAALLAGCASGAAAPSGAGVQQVELTVGGQPAVAVAPSGPAKALVLYLHGHDETHATLVDRSDQQQVVQRLVADGYVVAASDAHLDAWGSPASQRDYVALAAELSKRYGTTSTFLLAESMGGIAGLQILAHDSIPDVVGLAGISALVQLDVTAGTPYEAEVRQAYGGTAPTAEQNPAELPAQAFAGDHLRLYAAPDDTLVVPAQNSEPLVAKLQGIADISVVPCTGGHVNATCFQPDDLATWFDGLLRTASGHT